MKRLLFSLLALVLFINVNTMQATTTLPSSGTNTEMWNGSTWVTPYQIPRKDANAGANDATVVTRGWGWNCGCETLGDTARATTSCPWNILYAQGAEWVSDTTWSNQNSGNYTRYFRHTFNIPAGYFAKDMKVIIASDDTVNVLLDHTGNPTWTPYGSAFEGGASGTCELTTIDIGCVGSGDHVMQFVLKNTAARYFGMIYIIQYKLVRVKNIEISSEGDCCFAGKFTWFNESGSTLTNFDITPFTSGVTFTSVSVSGDMQSPRGWTASHTPTTASYTGGTGYSNCQLVETFHFCIDAPSNISSAYLQITYRKGRDILRQDTVQIKLDSCCNCDDINIKYDNVEDCCIKFWISSECNLTHIETIGIKVPAGISITSASAPAGFTAIASPPPPYSKAWRFPTPPGYFAAGTYAAFSVCFDRSTVSRPFWLVIDYMDGNYGKICDDSILIKCDTLPPPNEKECCTSIKFNGEDDNYIQLPPSPTAYVVPANDSKGFTWETWFKLNAPLTDTTKGWGQILICEDNNNPHMGQDIVLSFGATHNFTPIVRKDSLVFYLQNNFDGAWGFAKLKPLSGSFRPGQWYHVSAIMNYGGSQEIKLILEEYDCETGELTTKSATGTINGTLAPLAPGAGEFSPTIGCWDGPIGKRNGQNFNGWFDDIRFYNVPRTLAQIESDKRTCLYNFPTPAANVTKPNLTAYYPIKKNAGIWTDNSPGTIHDNSPLCGFLNGTAYGGTLMTQPPESNAAPMECCCICDSIEYNLTKIEQPVDDCECCYKLDITIPDNCNIDEIGCIRFRVDSPTKFCEDGTTPLPSGSWHSFSSNYVDWLVPPGTFPGTASFQLCFNHVTTGSFPIYIDILGPHCQRVVCKDTLLPKCKPDTTEDCCDRFKKKEIPTRVISWMNNVLLWGSVTIQPPPTIRFSASIAYIEKVCPNDFSHHTYSDIDIIAPPLLGTPPTLPLRTSPWLISPLPGDLHEAIWGSYHAPLSIATLNVSPFFIHFKIDPFPLYPCYLKFAIRYEWTGQENCQDGLCCCTCDTLIWYKVKLRGRIWTHKEQLPTMQGNANEEGSGSAAYITMKSFNEGTLNVWNPSEKESDDSFDIIAITLVTGDGVKPTSIKNNSNGKPGTVKDSTASVETLIKPEESGSYDLTFDNKNLAKFLCRLSVKIKLKDTGDTLTIPLDEFYARYNEGGDVVDVDTTANLNNVSTYALYLHNLNKGQEGIAKVELSLEENSKNEIMAVGSKAINQDAELGVYKAGEDDYFLYPVPAEEGVPDEITPDKIYRPIYITVRYLKDENIILNYRTLNSEGEVISENRINLQKPTLVKDNEGGSDNSIVLSIYPNPSRGDATLQINSLLETSGARLELMDMNGRKVKTIFDDGYIGNGINVYTLDLNDVPNGVYFLQLTTGSGTYTGKVIVTK